MKKIQLLPAHFLQQCHSFIHLHMHGSLLSSPPDLCSKITSPGFPGGAVVENPPANAGDTGSSPGLGGSHMPRSK